MTNRPSTERERPGERSKSQLSIHERINLLPDDDEDAEGSTAPVRVVIHFGRQIPRIWRFVRNAPFVAIIFMQTLAILGLIVMLLRM